MTLLTKNSEPMAIENSDKPSFLGVLNKYCHTAIIIVISESISLIFIIRSSYKFSALGLLWVEKCEAKGEKVNSRSPFPSENQHEQATKAHLAHKRSKFKSLLNLCFFLTPSLPSIKRGSSGI